jgi:hypothetical protein
MMKESLQVSQSIKFLTQNEIKNVIQEVSKQFLCGFALLISLYGGNYATSRKVAGSIPDEVIGFFN